MASNALVASFKDLDYDVSAEVLGAFANDRFQRRADVINDGLKWRSDP